MTVPTVLFTIALANLIYNLTGFIIKYCFDQSKRKKIDKHEDSVTSGYISGYMRHDGGVGVVGTMNNQIVYKVNGDFNGNIKGDNVTVILMGDGNINGNIESKDGNVVLIKGNVNGDIKANKVVCPTNPTTDNKDQHICKSCYHYVQTLLGGSYCTKDSPLGEALPEGCGVCKSYDGTGETTKYKSDCARFSNRSGICHVFHVNTCAIEHNCPYKIKRDECKTINNTAKHNPAKDVESPKLPVKTLWSCDIPQGTSPQKRIDHYTSIGNHVSIYDSFPVAHIKCPHCKKYLATQVKVHTSVVDGDVVETSVEEIKRDY